MVDTSWPAGTLPTDQKRVMMIEELVQGRKMATELQLLLNGGAPSGIHGGSLSAEELALKITTSFEQTLSVLTSCGSGDDDQQYSGTGCGGLVKVEPFHLEHSHCDDRSSQDSGESRKSPALKDRRGCYKRRKSSESWTVTSDKIDDGQAWRKYGQKEILNAPYPRAYFRCTRKYDQGCKATKQVQQIRDNPKEYNTTYIGSHTCRNTIKGPQMIIGGSDPPNLEAHNRRIITTPVSSESAGSTFPLTSPVKTEECKEAATTWSDLKEHVYDASGDVWADFNDHHQHRDFGFSTETPNMYVDMDMVVKSINFDSEFEIDGVAFPIL